VTVVSSWNTCKGEQPAVQDIAQTDGLDMCPPAAVGLWVWLQANIYVTRRNGCGFANIFL
jgi:hypothetical protein